MIYIGLVLVLAYSVNAYPTWVGGVVTYSNNTPVYNASVHVNCNGFDYYDYTNTSGQYLAYYSSAKCLFEDFLVIEIDNVTYYDGNMCASSGTCYYNITIPVSCYQESANVSNQTGIDGNCGLFYNGTYLTVGGNPTNWTDGNWSTFTPNNSTNQTLYVNYTKPLKANPTSQIIRKAGTETTNSTIPYTCWTQEPLQFKHVPIQSTLSSTKSYCWSGSTWTELTSLSILSLSPFYEDAMNWTIGRLHDINSVNSSVSIPTRFNTIMLLSNITDYDNNTISDVKFQVLYPNATLNNITATSNSSLFNASLYLYFNGTYNISVFTDDGNSLNAYNFVVNDNVTVTPDSFTSVKSNTENFTLNVGVTHDSTENLTFNNFTLTIQNSSLFTLLANNNVTFTPSASIPLIINTSSSAPDGTYNGNITFNRLVDGRSFSIPVSLGLSTLYGQPYIMNLTNWITTVQDTQSVFNTFVVNNTGGYTLTNCIPTISGSFANKSFVYFSSGSFNLTPNQSYSLITTFATPSAGVYQGYLDISCTAASGGQINTLALNNIPYIQLVSTSTASGGGGGGGSQTIIIDTANFTLSPSILDVYFIISSFNDKPKFWNYTFVASKTLTACTVDNGFSCRIVDNRVVVSKDFSSVDSITSKDSGTLTVYSGNNVITRPFNVRIINLAYSIDTNTNWPTFFNDLSLTNSSGGVYLIPIMTLIFVISGLWIMLKR